MYSSVSKSGTIWSREVVLWLSASQPVPAATRRRPLGRTVRRASSTGDHRPASDRQDDDRRSPRPHRGPPRSTGRSRRFRGRPGRRVGDAHRAGPARRVAGSPYGAGRGEACSRRRLPAGKVPTDGLGPRRPRRGHVARHGKGRPGTDVRDDRARTAGEHRRRDLSRSPGQRRAADALIEGPGSPGLPTARPRRRLSRTDPPYGPTRPGRLARELHRPGGDPRRSGRRPGP